MLQIKSLSNKAISAYVLVKNLQHYFVDQLENITIAKISTKPFKKVEWLRDQGKHGGGVRYVSTNKAMFNSASVNVSQVYYTNDVGINPASATALSTIIHPKNPFSPSVHIHISWTEMKTDKGYWRLMADLNPAIENKTVTDVFMQHLKMAAPEHYALASTQGWCYFYIPALERHRGVVHFYLEEYNSKDELADFNLAKKFGKTIIQGYLDLLTQTLKTQLFATAKDYQKQLAYHTLYLFQVLTLDRGTTSGLLAHKQNDLGIMSSLPSDIDKHLLTTWKHKLIMPQDKLLAAIVQVLPNDVPCHIDTKIKYLLAQVIRQHYKLYPQALYMLAKATN